MMCRGRQLSAFVLFISFTLACSISWAHDFWLQAQPYYQETGQRVDISLHVGEDMVGDSLPNIPNWYKDFSYIDSSGRYEMAGQIGNDPAGHFTPDRQGLYMVGYQSRQEFVSLKPDKFNQYLTQEGLEKILAGRQKLQDSDKEVREYYIRCVKSLIKVGQKLDSETYKQRFNYTLEIIPLANPYNLSRGDTLTVEILYRGKPVSNSLMVAFTQQQPEKKQKIRTDEKGRADIKLDRNGHWLIKTVEMDRYPADDAEWISYWASLTFELK